MKYKVQECTALRGKLPSGVRVGRIWQTRVVCKNRATAERLAQYQRQDLRHQRPIETRTAPVRIVT
jgi:hypothetical protein